LRRLFDRSAIGLLSVCAGTARTVVAVRSSQMVVLLLYSVSTRFAVARVYRDCTGTMRSVGYCDHKTSVLRQWATIRRTQSQSVSLSRCTVAVYSLYSLSTVGRFTFRVQRKNTVIRCDLCFGVTARWRLSGDHAATYGDRRRFEVAVVAVSRNSVWLEYKR